MIIVKDESSFFAVAASLHPSTYFCQELHSWKVAEHAAREKLGSFKMKYRIIGNTDGYIKINRLNLMGVLYGFNCDGAKPWTAKTSNITTPANISDCTVSTSESDHCQHNQRTCIPEIVGRVWFVELGIWGLQISMDVIDEVPEEFLSIVLQVSTELLVESTHPFLEALQVQGAVPWQHGRRVLFVRQPDLTQHVAIFCDGKKNL